MYNKIEYTLNNHTKKKERIRTLLRLKNITKTYAVGDTARIAYIQNARGDVVGHVNDLTTVIDFVDEFGMLKGWARQREKIYMKLGYQVEYDRN